MKAKRLRWHGSKRQQALAERLRLELKTWLNEWSVDPALLSLRIADDGLASPPDWCWLEATSPYGSVVLGARNAELVGLGGLLAKAEREDPLKLGRRIGDRALRALLAQFAGGNEGAVDFQDSDGPSAEYAAPKFGCCILALAGAGFDARVIVDNALFEYWVPPQKPALAPLVPRDAVLGNERVTLRVMLDLGTANLADAQDLQVGDVLVSNARLDSLFELVLPDSRRLVAANLLRKGDQLAVQIDAPISRKNS